MELVFPACGCAYILRSPYGALVQQVVTMALIIPVVPYFLSVCPLNVRFTPGPSAHRDQYTLLGRRWSFDLRRAAVPKMCLYLLISVFLPKRYIYMYYIYLRYHTPEAVSTFLLHDPHAFITSSIFFPSTHSDRGIALPINPHGVPKGRGRLHLLGTRYTFVY